MAKKYYQMLWDCGYCGTTKLLAKDQKVCPTCGGIQDPTKRYFPDMSEAQEVVGHVVKGVDRICGACDKVNPIEALNCTSCGASMKGAQEVARKVHPHVKVAAASSKKSTPWFKTMVATTGALILIYWLFLGLDNWLSKDRAFLMDSKSWQANVNIEVYGPHTRTYKCALPWSEETLFASYPLHTPVQVAQSDEGDGTFSVNDGGGGYDGGGYDGGGDDGGGSQTCTETYHDWGFSHAVSRTGTTLPVLWPKVYLSSDEREGKRYVNWLMELSMVGTARRVSCQVDRLLWSGSKAGSAFIMPLGFFTKKTHCDELRRAQSH